MNENDKDSTQLQNVFEERNGNGVSELNGSD